MRVITLSIILLLVSGCTFNPTTNSYQEDAESHILRVNRHGYMLDSNFSTYPVFERDSLTPKNLEKSNRQIDLMILNAIKLACVKSSYQCEDISDLNKIPPETIKNIQKVKLLVYAHGGLNTYSDTDERMESQLARIINDPKDWSYPIYISWPSNVLGTVEEHFFEVREGRDTSLWAGIFSSPFVLFEDLFTAVGRAPANVYYQFTNDKDRFASGWSNDFLSSVWGEADYQYQKEFFKEGNAFVPNEYYSNQRNNIKINRSTYDNSGFLNGLKSTGLVLVTPIRYVTGIVWNGTLAGDSWDMMKRRARAVAYPIGEFNRNARTSLEGQAVGRLFTQIFKVEELYPELNIELTLIGHSMGTIVLNNLLTRYQEKFESTKSLKNIIYMAAAANTYETLSIVPDILRNNAQKINFYNLTLNRVAEVAETYFGGLAPSGSLLVSIDKYHDAPEHHLLRTFGSEVNVQSSLPTIINAFSNMDDPVTLKAFNKFHDVKPYKHGHFGDILFWKCETWQIDTKDIAINCD